MTCLAIDIGNTRVNAARVGGRRVEGRRDVPSNTRAAASLDDFLRLVLRDRPVDGVAISSVVPPASRGWRAAARRVTGQQPLFVSCELALGVGVSYPDPGSIGADRLANASAAAMLYGCPCIVADFGTALTFDVIDGRGRYVGGVITPGLPFMREYLAEKTALLPALRLYGRVGRVGRSTEGAMRIGAKIGYRGMVREIIGYLADGLGGGPPRLCATGGDAEWALRGIDMPFAFDRHLTLVGIGRIFDLNAPREREA